MIFALGELVFLLLFSRLAFLVPCLGFLVPCLGFLVPGFGAQLPGTLVPPPPPCAGLRSVWNLETCSLDACLNVRQYLCDGTILKSARCSSCRLVDVVIVTLAFVIHWKAQVHTNLLYTHDY